MTKIEAPSPEAVAKMADEIEAFVVRYHDTTFSELMNRIDGFSALASHDEQWCVLRTSTMTIWSFMTETGVKAISKLFDERRLCVEHTNWLVYGHDGGPVPNDKDWCPLLIRPGAEANMIGLGGMPFRMSPKAMKAIKRRIAKDKKAGLPCPTLVGARREAPRAAMALPVAPDRPRAHIAAVALSGDRLLVLRRRL